MTAKAPANFQPIPGYELLEKIGQGGMGAVFKARQCSMDRIVAIKILPKRLAKQEEFKERFFREARAAGKLSHGNIVAAIDASEAGGYCYIAMEFVEGESLAERIDREGALSPKEALDITEQIVLALSHAWNADIVHRDVKPENFLYTADGTAKLCDLGIAKAPAADANLTQEGIAVGTPRYIAPEQAQALPDIDFRADIYSLGASLYHMLTGEPPFDGPSGAVIMLKHITDPLPSLRKRVPNITPGIQRLVETMMAKKPEDRYQDAESLLEDLRRARDGAMPAMAPAKRRQPRQTRAKGTRVKTATRRTRSSTRRMVAVKVKQQRGHNGGMLIAILSILILVILGYFVLRSNPTRPSENNPPSPKPAPIHHPSAPVSHPTETHEPIPVETPVSETSDKRHPTETTQPVSETGTPDPEF